MRYQNYERKIQKLVKIRNTIYRFRYVLISATTAIIAGVLTLNITKGSITNDIQIEDSIEYGTQLKLSSSAFLGSTSYEYKLVGSSTWSEETPLLVGEYLVRAYSTNSFGTKHYGSEHAFKITPKTVSVRVKESSITYGDDYSIDGKLEYSDTFTKFGVSLEPIDDFTTNVTLKGVKVNDENGNDVTNCYTFEYATRKVSIKKRPLTLASDSLSKEYDGTPLPVQNMSIISGSLASGDSISYTPLATSDAWFSKARFSAKITNISGDDVTNFYQITYQFGTLQINPRNITLKSRDFEKVYDGKGFDEANEYHVISGSLLDNHHLSNYLIDYNTLSNPLVRVSTNSFTSQVYDEDSNNVSNLYSINYEYGTVQIHKRNITIRTYSHNFTYSGQYVRYNSFDLFDSSLASGDYISSLVCRDVLFCGEYQNSVQSIQIRNASGDDVTDCYNITYVYGTVSVNKKEIDVRTSSNSFAYNGYPQKVALSGAVTCINGTSLASGDYFSYNINDFPTLTKVGSISNVIPYKIYNQNGNDVTDQYIIHNYYGTLTITQRMVRIYSYTTEKKYDGEPFNISVASNIINNSYYFSPSVASTDILSGVRLYTSSGSVGYYTPQFDLSLMSITHSSLGDVRDCYNVLTNTTTDSFKIAAREIILTPESIKAKYDGEYHISSTYTIGGDGLASGDTLTGIQFNNNMRKDVGSSTVTLSKEFAKIYDINGFAVPDVNYKITLQTGQITITPRYITVHVAHASKVFDNRPLDFDHSWTLTGDGLAPQEIDNLTFTNDQIINVYDVPEYTYNVFSKINPSTSTREDTTSNYVVSYDIDLKVTPLTINVKCFTNSYIYDGVEHVSLAAGNYDLRAGQKISSTSLGAGSSFPSYIGFTFTINKVSGTYVGNYALESFVTGVSAYEIDPYTSAHTYIDIANFEFTYSNYNLSIFKRNITVASPTVSLKYTGSEFINELDIIENSLADGDELFYDGTLMTIRDVTNGVVENTFNPGLIRIMRGSVNVTSNYNISTIQGSVQIYSEEEEKVL